MDENPLHADAGLSGVGECADDHLADVLPPRTIRFDHARGIAAEFQGNPLFHRKGFEPPTGLVAPGEGQHLYAPIAQDRRDMLVAEGQEGDLSGRHPAFGQHLAQQQRAERSLERGLEDHRVARGEARRDFVRHEVQGKIEGRDAENHAEGKTSGQTRVPRARRGGVHRNLVFMWQTRFRRREGKSGSGPLHFEPRQGNGLAGFGNEQIGEFTGAAADGLGGSLQ